MRKFALLILAAGLVSSTAAVRAQTYDPGYPVCMQIGEWGGWRIECSYFSLAQCAASGAGRGGTCIANPNFAASTGHSTMLGRQRSR
jgi:hypothetical protein